MDENLKILFGLLGGLAMFLYGMNEKINPPAMRGRIE